jgi:hypothetical protein
MNKHKDRKILPKPLPPDQADKYYAEKYYPEYEAWYHICPATFWGFFGRKNQIYLNAKVKSTVATVKRAKGRAPSNEVQIAINNNERILRKFYRRDYKGVNWWVMAMEGFDSSVPAKIHKNSFGLEIKFYGLYGYYFEDKLLLVRIFRKSSDYQKYQNFDGDMLHISDELKNFIKNQKLNGII